MQKNKFNQSIEDINDYFSLLEFIDSIETYKNIMLPNPTTNSSLLVTSTQQKCMRSHAVLMLYNIVEATVVEYEYGTANPAAKAQGIKLKYVGDKNYTAGKTFTLQLTFAATSDNDSKDMTLDGEVATEDAVVEGVSVLVK